MGRRPRKTPKSKWNRKVNKKGKKKPAVASGLSKKQEAQLFHLFGGNTLDESE